MDNDTGEVTYQNKSSCDHVKGANTCNYLWKKDGKELENGTKYSFNSRLTYDFCENFEKTGDFIRRFFLFFFLEIFSGFSLQSTTLLELIYIP